MNSKNTKMHTLTLPFLFTILTTSGMDDQSIETFYCPVTLKTTNSAFYLDQTPLQQKIFDIWGITRNLNDPVVAISIKNMPALIYRDDVALLQCSIFKDSRDGQVIPQALPVSLFIDKKHDDIIATLQETDKHGCNTTIHLTHYDTAKKPIKIALQERIKNFENRPLYISHGHTSQRYFEKKLLDNEILIRNKYNQIQHGPCGYFVKKPQNMPQEKVALVENPVQNIIKYNRNR